MDMVSIVPVPMGFGFATAFLLPPQMQLQAPAPSAPTAAAAASGQGRRRGRGGRAGRPQVSPSEIRAAVESLYRDQMRPFGRLIRKRLAEQAAQMGAAARHIEDRDLRASCTACRPWLLVTDADGGDWTAALAGQPQHFVDPHCPDDPYPEQLWIEFGGYLAGLSEDERLPGGRYLCALALAERNLPFFSRCSLGQLAHIVQLAISHRELLGYSDGMLVPYERSQSKLKRAKAERREPKAESDIAAVTDWDELRECFRQLFGDNQRIALSNIKFLFQSRFGAELSETALGYAKLSELLQDARLSDICEVRLQHAGHVLQPVRPRNRISLCESICPSAVEASEPQRRCRPVPLCLEDIALAPSTAAGSDTLSPATDPASSMAPMLTPVRTPQYPPTPMPYPSTPSPSSLAVDGMSLPRLLGATRATPFEAHKSEAVKCDAARAAAPSTGDMAAAPAAARQWAPRPLTPSTLDSLGFSVHNTFIHAVLPPPTPMRAESRLRARSLPRASG